MGKTMFANSKQAIKKIALISISTVIIGSFTVFSFSILGNVCSQVITNLTYYNAMMKQELTVP